MRDLYYLKPDQLSLIEPYFPPSRGVQRVDDLRVISGITGSVMVCASREYSPHKMLYNRFARWSRMGVFDKIFENFTQSDDIPEQLQIDAMHLKTHRTAASLLKKGCSPRYRTHERRLKLKTSCGS